MKHMVNETNDGGKHMKKSFVVGIAGGSGSGKTTFCNELVQSLGELKVKELHIDSYFKSEQQRPYVKAPFKESMYRDDNDPLATDLPKVPIDLYKAIESNSYDVIIVEGLWTLWDKNIYNQLDLKLFIDCDSDERLVRRIKRNMKWGLTLDEITNFYLDMVRYRHDEYIEPTKWRADFILNGSIHSEKAMKIITDYIKKACDLQASVE